MNSWISTPQVTKLLDELYADAARNDPLVFQAARESGASHENEVDFYRAMGKAYMPVGREFGNLLYSLVRTARAETVVEFGTSFGISTIFLASAVRDNGFGKVITSEFDVEKSARAQRNLAAAGLEDWVEFRVGDALQTLANDSGEIDLILLDGPKGLYLDMVKILEPRLRCGGIVASDNTDHDGMEDFLNYVRDPDNDYVSSAILTADHGMSRGHEITVRSCKA